MDRNNVEEKYKWNLKLIYKDEEQFNKDYNTVKNKINEFEKNEKIMNDNAETFYNTINEYFNISRMLEKLMSYTNLLFDEDTSNNKNQALKGKVEKLYNTYIEKSYFISSNILKKEYTEIEKYYKEIPDLKKYEIIIKNEYRYKEHTLSDSEEKLLSNISKMLNNNYETYELLKDSDLKYGKIINENNEEIEVSENNYSILIESKNRETRKKAFKKLYEVYKQYANSFASLLSGNITENNTISKIKKYDSTLEWCLYKDEVNAEVYDNLINTVEDNLDALYNYYNIKKELLKLDELHLYDIYVTIIDNYNKKYPFEEAKETVFKALNVLGDDYISILKKGIEDRWIDVYPTRNKRTGGYSGGCYDTNPYILLNYQDKYNDMSTLAHEAGHSMHSYYARSNNEYQYGDYTIFVAEVASTVNELLLAKYLLKESKDNNEKLAILDKLMNLYKSTIFRQTMFAKFEKEIYEAAQNDTVLTSEYLCNKYYEINKKYFGEDVIVDEEIKYEWERIPHFYYNFYVYKYATGLSAATQIVENILSGKENAVENYKEFLKCGSKKNPIESLKLAGVDLNNPEVVKTALEMFDDICKEFKKIYKENLE